MKRSAWILGVLVAAAAVGGFLAWRHHTEPARMRAELRELEGVDLRTLKGRARDRVESLFRRFADVEVAGIQSPTEPFTVFRMAPDTPSEKLLLARTGDSGNDQIVWIWDADKGYVDGKVWEGDSKLVSMRSVYRPEVDAWVLETVIAKAEGTTRHYRWLRESWFVLLRVEDGQGRALPVPLELRLHDIGGTAEQWAALLPTYRGAELVYWLAWLKSPGVAPGATNEPVLRSALEKYAASPNRWVSDAAKLAMQP
jgi:hypothetical protein